MNGTAIVTGGTGGLGTAVVETMIAGGWHVVVPWVAEIADTAWATPTQCSSSPCR